MNKSILIKIISLGFLIGCGGGGTDNLNINKIVTATTQSIIVRENEDKKITLTGGGDSDIVSYHIITKPKNGKLKGVAPNLTYIPNKDYFGIDSFTFKVSDSKEDSDPATVNLTIKAYRKLTETGGKYNYIWTYDKYGNILTKSRNNILVKDHTYTYDENGNILIDALDDDNDNNSDNNYNGTHFADGIIDKIHTYTYDKNGNILTEKYDWNADGVEDIISTFSYNKYGDKLSHITQQGQYASPSHYIWTYDKNRNKLTYYKNGNIDTWTYDKYGNVLSLIKYDKESGDSTTITYSYTYDTRGNILTKSTNNKISNTWTYDENQNMLTSKEHFSNSTHIYSYDENQNILTDAYDLYGISHSQGIHKYTYDENGNILTHINHKTNGGEDFVRAYSWKEVIAN